MNISQEAGGEYHYPDGHTVIRCHPCHRRTHTVNPAEKPRTAGTAGKLTGGHSAGNETLTFSRDIDAARGFAYWQGPNLQPFGLSISAPIWQSHMSGCGYRPTARLCRARKIRTRQVMDQTAVTAVTAWAQAIMAGMNFYNL